MQRYIHRAETRGETRTDWLLSKHTFSFAGYYDPQRMHFGKLRVLNDDVVQPGRGFDLHPHKDMEIISIVLKGRLKHLDNQGNTEIINKGMVQTITAGTGVLHGEFNDSGDEEVHFLQVWIFPDQKGLQPGYKTKAFGFDSVRDDFMTLVAPGAEDHTLSVNQNAWVTYGRFSKDESAMYDLHDHEKNGAYIFMLNGKVRVEDDTLNSRDGVGIEGAEDIPMIFDEDSECIIFEVPRE